MFKTAFQISDFKKPNSNNFKSKYEVDGTESVEFISK